MRRFQFRLASVVRLRSFELERARAQLARVEAERGRRVSVAREETERVARGKTLLDAETRQGATGDRLAMRADGVAAGRLRLAEAERAVAQLDPVVAEARRRVARAHARLKSLERLEAEQARRHRQAAEAVEQAEIEELAIGRLARMRAEGQRAEPIGGRRA